MHKIKEMLMRELKEYERIDQIKGSELEIINMLTDTIKNIDKIEMLEDGIYSEDGGRWMAIGSYNDEPSYDNGGSSYRRKRNRMGRYTRDGGMSGYARNGSYAEDSGDSYNSYRRGRYSRDGKKEQLVDKMAELMDATEDENEREIYRHCIDKLQNA